MNRKVLLAVAIAVLASVGVLAFCESGGRPAVGPGPPAAEDGPRSSAIESPLQSGADVQRERVAERPAAGADAAPGQGTGSLRIRVVDGTRDEPAADIGLVLRELHPDRPPPRRAQTDENGEAVVTNLRPGPCRVGTDRHFSAREEAVVVAGQETRVTLTLDETIHLTGVVVDARGTPVAGAVVLLGMWGGGDPVAVTHTGDDGRFAIRPAPRVVNVAARAAGHAPSAFRTVTAGAGADVDVRLVLPGEGGTVSGVVVDPDGRGVADAVVRIGERLSTGLVITLPDGAKGLPRPQPTTRSDESGRFALAGVEPGRQPVTVRTETFATWSGAVDIVARADTPMTIRLIPGLTCEGTVRSEAGELLADVRIRSGERPTDERRYAFTDAEGEYRLTGLPPGEPVEVHALGDEHGRAETKIMAAPGETVVWNVTLSPGLVLRGRVLGRNGEPVEGAFLSATARSFGQFTRTDADGAFEIAGCPKGVELSVEVTAKGHAPLRRSGLDPTAGPALLQMVYEGEPDTRIVGRVVDPDGAAVADAQIFIGRDGGGGGALYTASADGEIAIEELWPGLLNVRIRARSFASFVSEERRVANGETWNLGTVVLSRGGNVEVHLHRTSATEDARIHVSIYRGEQWLSGFDTRPTLLRSDPLAPGGYELRVWGPAIAPENTPFSVRVDETTRLEVRPEPAAPCVMTMTVPEGREDVASVGYRILSADRVHRAGRARRSPDDTFPFETGLKPGSYTLHAWTDDGLRGRVAFEVRDSAETRPFRLALR